MKIFTSKTQKIGEIGEEVAAKMLKNNGFTVVERNIANKYGEIDIVAQKGGKYYFFEVKAGRAGGFINPAENLTRAKLRKFLISVQHYALVHQIREYIVQGIVVLLDANREAQIEILDLF